MQKCILVYNRYRDLITSSGTVYYIKEALESLDYDVKVILFDRDFINQISDVNIVFNYYTSANFFQCLVPLILEWLNIPYTGSRFITQVLAMDKEYTSILLKSYKIPVPAFSVVRDLKCLQDIPSFPLIVKPALGGSSEGITKESIAKDADGLRLAVESLFSKGFKKVMISSFIEGEEITVGIVGSNPPIVIGILKTCIEPDQILTSKLKEALKVYDERIVPYRGKAYERITKIALTTYDILGCRGCARIDIRLSLEGTPYVIDINTIPGLHPEYSYLPRMAEEFGLGYKGLIKAIMDDN